MDINIADYLTFRNIILTVFCLPLLTMLASLPFLWAIPKGVREIIVGIGYLAGVASGVVAIELIYRTIANIIAYKYQKPQIFYDIKLSGMTSRYEPFDSTPLLYLIVFVSITIATWFVADIYSTKMKMGRLEKPYSEKNPLNLNK